MLCIIDFYFLFFNFLHFIGLRKFPNSYMYFSLIYWENFTYSHEFTRILQTPLNFQSLSLWCIKLLFRSKCIIPLDIAVKSNGIMSKRPLYP
jgi:hypothetical protein